MKTKNQLELADKLNSCIKAMDCCFNCLSANVSKERFTPKLLKTLKIFGCFEIIKAVRGIQNEAPEKMQFVATKNGIDFKIDAIELEVRLPDQQWVNINKKIAYGAFSYIAKDFISTYTKSKIKFKKLIITKSEWTWKYGL